MKKAQRNAKEKDDNEEEEELELDAEQEEKEQCKDTDYVPAADKVELVKEAKGTEAKKKMQRTTI